MVRINKDKAIIITLIIILIVMSLISLWIGEIEITFIEVLKSIIQKSTPYNNNVVFNIRLPRVIVGIMIGATLSISGLFTSIAMRNSLADSGILGIQSGATVGALITLLVFPTLVGFLPIFSFIGGLIAFILLITATSMHNSFKPTKVVLVGVAINALATSIIGIITILNATKVKNALTWLNGSLISVSSNDMKIVLIYSLIVLTISFSLLPIVKLLRLDDNSITNVGHNPTTLRIIISLLAVLLASISVAFVGIISFIGIIAPQIAKRIVTYDLKTRMIASMLIGSILIIATDLIQRIVFYPTEIPVGILIGVIGAPTFIILAGGSNNDSN